MIVRQVWPSCTIHDRDPKTGWGHDHPPRRCFFVGVTDDELPQLAPLIPAHQQEDLVTMDSVRRDEWYRVAEPAARRVPNSPRYWWFLVADDLSRADLCAGYLPAEAPYAPLFAQVSSLAELARLPT